MKAPSQSLVPLAVALTVLCVPWLGKAGTPELSRWQRRAEIRLSGYRGAAALTGFPVLVSFAPAAPDGFSYHDLKPGGADLRFTDAAGTELLSHEIESWDTNGVSRVWVRVPALTSDGVIWAY